MGDLEKRLRNLEGRTPPSPRARPGRVTGAEIRDLEAQIRLLEAGVGEVRAAPEAAVFEEPDDRVAAVVREIERLEQLDHARDEGTRWEK